MTLSPSADSFSPSAAKPPVGAILPKHAAPTGVGFWLRWSGATGLAFGLTLLCIEVGEKTDISLLEAALGGLMVGFAQWQVLRLHLYRAYGWMVATVLAWVFLTLANIGAVGWMAPSTPSPTLRLIYGVLHGGYAGLVLGSGQWFVLRRQIPQAWRWIGASVLIWAIAIALGWGVGGLLRLATDLFISDVLGLLLAWGAIAVLSGISLGLLMHPSRRR
ncbi:hypothetical protein IQ241_19945 [Romeria aff. gracilis LEGE 07310]|uniref:Uncharacterized protein n=1 Tax=Vasconcelosia minhoensis LEGE 07310 TaxID=915328 RepID=A0A8J7AI54_9CYAN|nr:hypothetical protein [Romeria gracilis]MBE9079541.1 hypothetical protein [Romeria aff. gracilis LEGE 07310]